MNGCPEIVYSLISYLLLSHGIRNPKKHIRKPKNPILEHKNYIRKSKNHGFEDSSWQRRHSCDTLMHNKVF